jgi:hypothetical protein
MDLHALNHAAFYLLLLIIGAMTVWVWLIRRTFLRSHPSIATQVDLDDLKRLAKTDMYCALALLALAASVVAVGVIAYRSGDLSEYETLGVWLLGSIGAIIAGVLLIMETNKVRSLPVEGEALQAEVTHVLKTWKSKMLPDW